MINFLKGTIIALDSSMVTLDVHGVGYAITLIHSLSMHVGDQVELYIAFQWHQEHGPQLFGFREANERQLFLLLISCSGIGPKMALSLLNMGVKTVVHAIVTGDCKTLSSAPGIGLKKAELIVMQLKDKLEKLYQTCDAATMGVSILKEVSDALGSLGYSRLEITAALDFVRSSMQPQDPFDLLLKRALSFLVKRK